MFILYQLRRRKGPESPVPGNTPAASITARFVNFSSFRDTGFLPLREGDVSLGADQTRTGADIPLGKVLISGAIYTGRGATIFCVSCHTSIMYRASRHRCSKGSGQKIDASNPPDCCGMIGPLPIAKVVNDDNFRVAEKNQPPAQLFAQQILG